MSRFGDKILLRRAQEYIERYHPLLIGVAGRLNQTLTKQAIAQVLQPQRMIHSMSAPYTGAASVATAFLGMNSSHLKKKWWKLLIGSEIRELAEEEPDTHIVEVGPNVPGDIDLLAQTFPFFMGVVTGVPTRNLELFFDKTMVAHEIESLLVQLPRQGYAVLNIDDPLVASMMEKTVAQVITYGSTPTADIHLIRSSRVQQGIGLQIEVDNTHHEIYVPHLVSHDQSMSVLAALAVAKALQIDIKKAVSHLTSLTPMAGHLKRLNALNNALLLDASYDATPEDMLAALDALQDLPGRRKIAVLGLFTDLAHQNIYWNQEVSKKAGEVAHITILIGTDIPEARKAALQAGSDVHHFKTSLDAGKWLGDYIQSGDVILVNGPQEATLEEVVFRLLPEAERGHKALLQDAQQNSKWLFIL